MQRTPRSTLFPYTTLFRSQALLEGRKNMQRFFTLLALSIALVVPSANAAVINYVTTLSGPNESPTNLSRSEEHTSELQSRQYLVCRLLLEKKNPSSAAGAF